MKNAVTLFLHYEKHRMGNCVEDFDPSALFQMREVENLLITTIFRLPSSTAAGGTTMLNGSLSAMIWY